MEEQNKARWLSTTELCKELNVSRGTILNLTRQGKLSPQKHSPRKWFYDLDEAREATKTVNKRELP